MYWNSVGGEIIVLEDLRSRGFEASKSWLQDEAHALLVLREAARLHGAGRLLQLARGAGPLTDVFPLLKESWTLGEDHRDPFQKVRQLRMLVALVELQTRERQVGQKMCSSVC